MMMKQKLNVLVTSRSQSLNVLFYKLIFESHLTMSLKHTIFLCMYPAGYTVFCIKMDVLQGIRRCQVYKLLFTRFIHYVTQR